MTLNVELQEHWTYFVDIVGIKVKPLVHIPNIINGNSQIKEKSLPARSYSTDELLLFSSPNMPAFPYHSFKVEVWQKLCFEKHPLPLLPSNLFYYKELEPIAWS